MKSILIIAATLFVVFLVSCSGQKRLSFPEPKADSTSSTTDSGSTGSKGLVGKWDVVKMNAGYDTSAESLSDVFLTFADSSFGGKAPCNHIGGSYIMNGSSISFNDIISTKMACERIEQENRFVNLLDSSVKQFSITENLLQFKDASNRVVLECKRTDAP
jgi:heat shock protein HslJ